jgi:hypothetical protein
MTRAPTLRDQLADLRAELERRDREHGAELERGRERIEALELERDRLRAELETVTARGLELVAAAEAAGAVAEEELRRRVTELDELRAAREYGLVRMRSAEERAEKAEAALELAGSGPTLEQLQFSLNAADRWCVVIPPENEAAGCVPCDTCPGFRAAGQPCSTCAAAVGAVAETRKAQRELEERNAWLAHERDELAAQLAGGQEAIRLLGEASRRLGFFEGVLPGVTSTLEAARNELRGVGSDRLVAELDQVLAALRSPMLGAPAPTVLGDDARQVRVE